jgi:hypothetical protein
VCCYDSGKEADMIELTEEQRKQIAHEGWPPAVVNPDTGESFVLLHAELFERVRSVLEEEDEIAAVREMYPLVSQALDQQDGNSSRESA